MIFIFSLHYLVVYFSFHFLFIDFLIKMGRGLFSFFSSLLKPHWNNPFHLHFSLFYYLLVFERIYYVFQVRRSLKIRGRRREKEKLPSGITADYTADFLASLERVDSPATIPGSPSVLNHLSEGYTQSDSSETSLNSLNNPLNQKNLPPIPPKPPKRGILKTPRVNVTNHQINGDNVCLINTLQNELITYQNVPQNGVNGETVKHLQNTLLVITSTSPSADSLTDTTNSSFATPPFSMSPIGESQGFHRWSRTANFDELNLPLPPIMELVLPKPRTLTVQRQKPPRNDFGFSLRRAMVLERDSYSGDVKMKAVIFAEPGTIVQHNNETGLLPGDKLLEVNGVKVEDKSREDIIDLIKASGDAVTLKVSFCFTLTFLFVICVSYDLSFSYAIRPNQKKIFSFAFHQFFHPILRLQF